MNPVRKEFFGKTPVEHVCNKLQEDDVIIFVLQTSKYNLDKGEKSFKVKNTNDALETLELLKSDNVSDIVHASVSEDMFYILKSDLFPDELEKLIKRVLNFKDNVQLNLEYISKVRLKVYA